MMWYLSFLSIYPAYADKDIVSRASLHLLLFLLLFSARQKYPC